MPGIVTLVSRRGEVHVDAIGALAVDGQAPMRRDTIVRIASSETVVGSPGRARGAARKACPYATSKASVN